MYKIKIFLTSILVFLLVGSAFAQTVPVSSFTASPTNGTCLSNGSITATIPAPESPNTYEAGWIVEIKNLNNTNSTPQSKPVPSNGGPVTFGSLSPAKYQVTVKNSSSVSLTPVELTIISTYVAITATTNITEVKSTCPGGNDAKLTVNYTGGVGPFIYSIKSTDPITKAPIAGGTDFVSSPTNDRFFTFTDLKDGGHVSYSITDACGQSLISHRQLSANNLGKLEFAPMHYNFERECTTSGSSTNCASVKMYVNLSLSSVNADPVRLTNLLNPGNSKITINGTPYNLTYVGKTNEAYRFTYNPTEVSGPQLKDNDVITTSFNWGCETLNKSAHTVYMKDNQFSASVVPEIVNCELQYRISILGSAGNPERYIWYCPETTRVKVEKITSTGDIQVYPDPNSIGTFNFTSGIFAQAGIGAYVQDIGKYRVTVSDACQSASKIVDVVKSDPLAGISMTPINGIAEGTAGINFTGMPNGMQYNVKITPTDPNAPTRVIIPASTKPLNYNPIQKEIVFPYSVNFTGPMYIVDLPIGSYNVELAAASQGCISGDIKILKTLNLTTGAAYNFQSSVTEGCANSNTINYALNPTNALNPNRVLLTNLGGTELASTSSISGQFSNVAGGDYILKFTNVGTPYFHSALHKRTGPFEYSSRITVAQFLPIGLDITTVFCDPSNSTANSGNISVKVASGTLNYPLTMTLLDATKTNTIGATVNLTSPTREHVFSGLAAGTYYVRVTSACSSVDQQVALTTANTPPTSTASQLTICKGSSTNLSAFNASNELYDITWYIVNPDNNLGASVGTGMPLQVSPIITTKYRGVFNLKPIYSCSSAVNNNLTSDITIEVPEDPKLDLTVSDIDLCPNSTKSVTISNSESGFKYEVLDKLGNSYSPKVEFNGNGGDLTFTLPSQVSLTPGESLQVRSTRISLGCTGILTDKIVVSQSALNVALDLQGSANCPGGDGKITIKASQAGITYAVIKDGQLLSPSISALGTGNDLVITIPAAKLTAATNEFGIRATATGCILVDLSQKATITILQNPTITNVVHAVCDEQKGGFELNVTGGSGNNEYSLDNSNWVSNNIFTGLEPGSYTVYVKDKTLGCIVQNTITILNHCLEITKTSTTNPNYYQKTGDVLSYSITVKNNGTANLSNVTVKDPLTGMNETVASLAVGASQSFTTTYTTTAADQGLEKVDNTATATFTYGTTNYNKVASASVPNGFVVSSLDCSANSYSISGAIATTLDVLIPYSGGTAASYAAGQPINLGNGTLTATLQAGTINPAGGNLVYRVVGTSATNNKVILPVVFGGKSCQVEIYIYEPNVSTIDFTINTYNDKNKNCVKDAGESQSDVNTNGLYIKIYDLDNKLVYSNPAFFGQFDVQGFNGLSDVIYYYIIDNNDTEADTSPNLLKGWSTGMPAPSLKRYFQYSAGAVYFNTSPVSNLSDVSWDASLQRICMSQKEGTISSLDCSNAVFSSTIKKKDIASGTLTVNYTGGNGGYFAAQTVTSIGITGLTATLGAGSFNDGAGSLIFSISGTPTVAGAGKFSLNIGGQTCEVNFNVLESSLNITKVSTQSSFKLPGEVLDYVITVNNTGTADLTNIQVSDPLTGMNETIATLAAGASKTFTTQYTVKSSDLEAGKIENTAKAVYTFVGQTLEASASKTINAIYPSLSLTKVVTENSYKAIGDVLNYTITVKNTGAIDLTNIQVTDPLTGMNVTLANLLAGDSKALTTTYTVKQADLTAGKIENTAKASFSYAGKTQEQTATITVNAVYPTISITKEANEASFGIVGDVLNYTITVKNTGNVDLNNIQVTDPLTGMNETIAILAIGQSKSFNTSYTIKQADITAGKVDNIAKANYGFEGTNYNPTVTETVVFVMPKSVIEASNDDYTNKPLNILESGKLGNVLNNDKLNGVAVKASEVNISVSSNGGLTGLSIDADGNMIIPIGSKAGIYTIKYSICEKSDPSNCSEASVTLELIHGVNLRIFKSVEFASWFEGNEVEYLLKVENNGNTNATNVVAVDNLPQGLRYISSTISGGTALTTVKDQQISWTFAGLAAGASVEIKLKVKAAPLSNGMGQTIVNTAQVSSIDTELSPKDNTASVSVRIDPFFIPNTITPNGDMTNDTFEIPGLGRFVSNELVIFNRWNDQVFQAKNYQNNWAAAGLVSGTYFYILKTTDEAGKVQDYKGYIQVVKESIR